MPDLCINYSTGPFAVEVADVLLKCLKSGEARTQLRHTRVILEQSDDTLPVVVLVTGDSYPNEKTARALSVGGSYVTWFKGYRVYLVVGQCEYDFYTGATPKTWVGEFTKIGMGVSTQPILSPVGALRLLGR